MGKGFRVGFAALAVTVVAACGPNSNDGTTLARPDAVPTTAAPATTAATTTTTSTTTSTTTTTTTTTRPFVRVGDDEERVRIVQDKLRALGYDPGPSDGRFGPATLNAVWAFQRINGLPSDGDVGPLTMAAFDNPKQVEPMLPDGPPNRVEVSINRKLLVVYRDGAPALITHVSSGSRIPFCENGVCGDAVTPVGTFRIRHKINGWEEGPLGRMYNSMYFIGPYAIHGSPSVPDVGASHGCVRVPMHIAEYLPGMLDFGLTVHVQEA